MLAISNVYKSSKRTMMRTIHVSLYLSESGRAFGPNFQGYHLYTGHVPLYVPLHIASSYQEYFDTMQ